MCLVLYLVLVLAYRVHALQPEPETHLASPTLPPVAGLQ